MSDASLLSNDNLMSGSPNSNIQDPNFVGKQTPVGVVTQPESPTNINRQLSKVGEEVSSGIGKEQKEAFGGPAFQEVQPEVSGKKEFEIPPEAKDWMQQIEEGEEISFPGPIKDDFGQILMEAAKITKPQFNLPLDDKGVKIGLQHKIADSIRWMAEWCLRLIKMIPDRLVYSQSPTISEGDK